MINRRRVAALVRKDMREIVRNPQVLAPLIVVPLMFVVVIPVAIILLGRNPGVLASVNGLSVFLDNLPTGLLPAGFTEQQIVVYSVMVFFLAPLFLIIPVMFSSVIASSSFVGEKERRTIEGLLYTPLSDRELVLGKVLVSVIPAVLVSWVGFGVYVLIAAVLAAPIIGYVFFPTPTWVLMIVFLVPLMAFLATALTVAVSGRSRTMQGAQGISMLVLLPVLGMVVSQAAGLVLFDVPIVIGAIVVLAIVDVVAYLVVVAQFSREGVVTRL